MFAVVPAHGNDRVRVTSRDSLQGQLHGEIEVLAQDRLDALEKDPADEFVPLCPDFVLELRLWSF